MHVDVIEESVNAEKFINCLQKLPQDAGCPIFVIADNARYVINKYQRSIALFRFICNGHRAYHYPQL
jgi:hypothetical protein